METGALIASVALHFNTGENLLALLMLGLATALLAPRYATALFRERAEAAARQIAKDLRAARTAASKSGAAVAVVFSPTTNSYHIEANSGGVPAAQAVEISVSDPPLCVRLLSADFALGQTVSFDAKGVPSHAGTITVCAGDDMRTVTVNGLTGDVTVE